MDREVLFHFSNNFFFPFIYIENSLYGLPREKSNSLFLSPDSNNKYKKFSSHFRLHRLSNTQKVLKHKNIVLLGSKIDIFIWMLAVNDCWWLESWGFLWLNLAENFWQKFPDIFSGLSWILNSFSHNLTTQMATHRIF